MAIGSKSLKLSLPTVGQAADDYTANRSNNKNWSINFRDNCTWQTNEQTESGSDKPAGPRRQLDERDYQPDSKPTKKRPEQGGFFIWKGHWQHQTYGYHSED